MFKVSSLSLLVLMCLVTSLAKADLEKVEPVKQPRVAIEKEVGDISGCYECNGLEGGGKKYAGVCSITKKNEVYIVQWAVGSSAFTGIGVRQGNSFAVSWAMPGEKGIVKGVNLYKIEAGPRLVGRWTTLPGNGILQSETLTFLKALQAQD